MNQYDDSSFDEERRGQIRYDARLNVNYRQGDTFLYSRSSNVSEMGIFLLSETPFPPGSVLELEFAAPGSRRPIRVTGQVRWVETGREDTEAGMGIQFIDLKPEVKAQLKSLVRTIAYLE
jgi:uncharacterized protein (TIGR02266 family)